MPRKVLILPGFLLLLALLFPTACENPSSPSEPEVKGVTVTSPNNSVEKGSTEQFSAVVSVSGGASKTVTWSVSGTSNPGTSISESGLLTVAANETAPSLKVTAKSVFDETKSGSKIVTVTGPAAEQLPVPVSPALSDEGLASWDAPANETNIEKYSLQLYKGTEITGTAVEVNKGEVYSHNFLAAMRSAGAGSYTFKVKSVSANADYADSAEVTSNTQSVVQRPQATDLAWSGDIATWSAGTGDTFTSLGYEVKLYQYPVENPVREETQATTSIDFGTDIETTGNQSYTFTVTALGNSYLVLPAEPVTSASKEIWNEMWLIGTMIGTNFDPPGSPMTKESNGTFTWESVSEIPAESYFRLSLTSTGTDFFAPAFNNTELTLGDSENSMSRYPVTDNTWKISNAGYYEITVKPVERLLLAERPVTVDSIEIITFPPLLLLGHEGYEFFAELSGKNTDLAEITWTVSDNEDSSTAFGTGANANKLTVAAGERAASLTITASSGGKTSAPITISVKDPAAFGEAHISFEIVDKGGNLDIQEGVPVRTMYKTGGDPGTDDILIFTVDNPTESPGDYLWYVNGITKTGYTITLNAEDFPVGYHSMRLTVTIGGVPWSMPTELGFYVDVAAVKP